MHTKIFSQMVLGRRVTPIRLIQLRNRRFDKCSGFRRLFHIYTSGNGDGLSIDGCRVGSAKPERGRCHFRRGDEAALRI